MGKVKLQKLDKYRIEKTSFPMTGYHGDLVIIHLRRMDFPWNKPSMNWGSPVYENHHMYIKLYIYNLVGGLAHFLFSISYIGNFIIPTDELLFFRGIEITNQTMPTTCYNPLWISSPTNRRRIRSHADSWIRGLWSERDVQPKYFRALLPEHTHRWRFPEMGYPQLSIYRWFFPL